MISRHPLPLAILSLVAFIAALGCQGSTDSFYSGVLSKPSELASGIASRTREYTSRLTRPRPVEKISHEPNMTEESYADVQLAMGRSFEQDGNLEAAEAAYEAALRNHPSLAMAHHRLALIKEKTGRGSESLVHFQTALELSPSNPDVHCDAGYCYYLRRNWDLAEQYLRRAIDLDPKSARAHNNLALVLARTDRSDVAMQHFAQAGLTAAQAHTNLGFVHLTNEQFSMARARLNQAIAADPRAPEARALMASLDRVAARPAARTVDASVSSVPPSANAFRPDSDAHPSRRSDIADSFTTSRTPDRPGSNQAHVRLAQFDTTERESTRSTAMKRIVAPTTPQPKPEAITFSSRSPGREKSLPASASRRTIVSRRAAGEIADDAPIVFGSGYGEQR